LIHNAAYSKDCKSSYKRQPDLLLLGFVGIFTPLKCCNFMFVTPCLQKEVYNFISINQHYLFKSNMYKKMNLSGKQCNLEINP